MLTYTLARRGKEPLYEYLYRCIREDILKGELQPDTKLPSKRALAEHLGVAVITVETAYQQLEAEGYLVSAPRRGFFVARVEQVEHPAHSRVEIAPKAEAHYLLDLKENKVNATRFPIATWARLTRQVLSEGSSTLLSAVPHQGLYALRAAIARDLWERKGMAVSPEQIVVGAGAEYLYLILAQLLGRDTVLAVEDPGYPKIRRVYEKWGVPCVPIPLDAQGIAPEALVSAKAKVLHLSPSHHYPTGLVTPIARRQALLRWAEEQDALLIEDDYDSEFRFSGRPLPTLQSIDRSGRVVYMNTFSQTISPSMRVGFMVLPSNLLERYRRELDFYACTVPAMEQHVLARFLDGGYYGQHIARMRKTYRSLRGKVLESFRTLQHTEIVEEGAGLHFLLRLQTETSDQVISEKARQLGVNLSFLSDFAVQFPERYAHTLVINYAGLEEKQIDEHLALLKECLQVF